jgi:hypothetical protein
MEIIDIKINNCYCCFNETEHRSPCECGAYICKKCFKKYKKYETECKICKTDLIIDETSREKFIRGFNDTLENCDDYLSLCLINILCHPICMILLCFSIVFSILLIPSFIYSIFITIISNSKFRYIFNIGTWLGGIVIIFLITVLLTCIKDLFLFCK